MSALPSRPAPDELRIFRGLFLFGLLVSALALAYMARTVLTPFLLAGVLAYLMGPLVGFMELRGLKRSMAVSVLYVAVLAVFAALACWVYSIWWEELPRLRQEWPLYLQQIKASAARVDVLLRHRWPWVADRASLTQALKGLLADAQASSRAIPVHYLSNLAVVGLNLFLVPFVAFHLLRGGRDGFQAMLDACPGRWVERFLGLLYRADRVIGNYLRGVLTEAFLVGTCAGLGLLLIGVDYAGLLGALTLVFNLVPFLGPLAAGALAVGAAFVQSADVLAPAQTALLFLSLRLVDDFVFQPLVMNRAVHMHPALVIFSILAGHEVGGVWGLLLAVPAVSIVKESILMWMDWVKSERGLQSIPASLARAADKPWVV